MARSWRERPPKRVMRCAFWAVGGDGTVLEVVRGAEFHKNAAVGVYPCGSGNDFVRSFGKREVFLNPENQLAGKTVSIDMIRHAARRCREHLLCGF